jgi:Ricin-type beta-trefoil lectin domain-like
MVVLLAIATVGAVHPGQANAAPVTFTSTAINQAGGNCANVPGSANGQQVVLASCNGAGSQNLTFVPVSGTADQYNIRTLTNNSCVDVFGASTADNATIIQWTCHTNNNQRFRLQAVSIGGATNTFNVVSVHSGKCIVPAGSSTANNTGLVQLPCSTATVRVWRLPSYNPGTPGGGGGWNPPSNLVTPLNQVWTHQETTYPNLYGFRNYGWDQLIANGGYVNYCVRWDSSASVSVALRDQVHATLARQFKKWMDVMVDGGQGWNNWPYTNVPVRVVGWAVRNRAQLQWSDTSVDIYVNDIRENAPQCSQPCGRFFNQNGSYPNCPGGVSHHYDMSLWLTDGFGGGAGGDWGQRMGREYFTNNLNSENITIYLHEVGHTFGLDDFYDWTPTGVCCFIMKAGSSGVITEFDRWMFRDWWRHLKSRYGR